MLHFNTCPSCEPQMCAAGNSSCHIECASGCFGSQCELSFNQLDSAIIFYGVFLGLFLIMCMANGLVVVARWRHAVRSGTSESRCCGLIRTRRAGRKAEGSVELQPSNRALTEALLDMAIDDATEQIEGMKSNIFMFLLLGSACLGVHCGLLAVSSCSVVVTLLEYVSLAFFLGANVLVTSLFFYLTSQGGVSFAKCYRVAVAVTVAYGIGTAGLVILSHLPDARLQEVVSYFEFSMDIVAVLTIQVLAVVAIVRVVRHRQGEDGAANDVVARAERRMMIHLVIVIVIILGLEADAVVVYIGSSSLEADLGEDIIGYLLLILQQINLLVWMEPHAWTTIMTLLRRR